MSSFSEAERVGAEKHPNNVGKRIQYGTAGFRTKSVFNRFKLCQRFIFCFRDCRADILDHVMYRMGLLAVLRSKLKKGISTIFIILFYVFPSTKVISQLPSA